MRRTRTTGIGIAVVIAVAAAACSGGSDDEGASYESTPCPNPIVAGVPAIDLGPDFECGYLTVPENRSVPDGPTIRIAVARGKAVSAQPKPDPILYLTGGPGGTGLASAVSRVDAGWNAERDVIFIDQRGTLKAEPLLACPEVDAFFQAAVGLVATDPATAALNAEATQACHDRLVAEGWDLAAYDTTENASDIADLRVALGIDEWNVYGVSYGTDLALQLLRDRPEGIRSLVLDSLVPPQNNLIGEFWKNAAEGYTALFAACADDAACQAAFPDVATEFTTLVNDLTTSPRTVTVTDATGGPVDVVIDGYTLANLVVVASLVPGKIAALPSLIHDLATGDGTEAAMAVLANVPPKGLTGYGLTYGVFCREQIAFTDLAEAKSIAERVLPEFPELALSLIPQAPRVFDDCATWDVGRSDPAVKDPTLSDLPVLLLSGELDAVTPPSWAEIAATGLPNSQLLRFPGAGHDVMIWSPECAVTVMHNFLDQPGGEWDDSCVASVHTPPFTTS